jgi:hypothetical protein
VGKAFFKSSKKIVDECNNFRGTIWKDAKSVAFGMKDNWLVAWVEYSTALPAVAVGKWSSDPRDTVTAITGTAIGTWSYTSGNENKSTLDSTE